MKGSFLRHISLLLLDFTVFILVLQRHFSRYEESLELLNKDPELFKEKVQATLRRHVVAVNKEISNDNLF